LKRILENNPQFAPANIAMAGLLLIKNKPDAAVEDLKAVPRADPKQLRGKAEAAAQPLKAVRRVDPNHLEANRLLANYCERRGNRETAIQHLRVVAKASPESEDVKLRLANLDGR